MHAAAANDPPLLLARNLLGGPLRTTSAALTGCGCGNTCMPGAIVELGRGSPTQREAHETPRGSLLVPYNHPQIAVDSYFIIMSNGRGPSKRHLDPLLCFVLPRSPIYPTKATFLAMMMMRTQKIGPLFCSVLSAAIGQRGE